MVVVLAMLDHIKPIAPMRKLPKSSITKVETIIAGSMLPSIKQMETSGSDEMMSNAVKESAESILPTMMLRRGIRVIVSISRVRCSFSNVIEPLVMAGVMKSTRNICVTMT